MVKLLTALVGSALLVEQAWAHPGHDLAKELKARNDYLDTLESRDLTHCAKHFEKINLQQKIAVRRVQIAAKLREERGFADAPLLQARDFVSVLGKNHHSNLTGINPQAAASTIFGTAHSAILSPETTEGPFVVDGELIRSNISETQKGVDLVIDIQLINHKTCEPISGVAIDLWHSNATGVYGGVVSAANAGNINDLSNVNTTFFRGVQISDKDGVVAFQTKVPGHYGGRTNHLHILSHHNFTVLPNKTISGGYVSHSGQMFLDQSLVEEVEKVEPYASNHQLITPNSQDFIMMGASDGDDPILEYVLLGKSVKDGIFGWINVGIDPAAVKNIYVAANYKGDGGHMNPPMIPSFPPGFTFPTGVFPSGLPFSFPTGMPSFPSGFSFPPLPSGFTFPGFGPASSSTLATSASSPKPPAATTTTTRT